MQGAILAVALGDHTEIRLHLLLRVEDRRQGSLTTRQSQMGRSHAYVAEMMGDGVLDASDDMFSWWVSGLAIR
jgi:hypothetical protein